MKLLNNMDATYDNIKMDILKQAAETNRAAKRRVLVIGRETVRGATKMAPEKDTFVRGWSRLLAASYSSASICSLISVILTDRCR